MRASTQCDITVNQTRVPADAVGRRIGAPADLHPGRRQFEPTHRATCVSSPGATANRIRALGRIARSPAPTRAIVH
jgi:hypothetical protein